MGINSNIKREWRSLPAMYQGLELPSFPLIELSKKMSFLQGNWGCPGIAQSDGLSLAYDVFSDGGWTIWQSFELGLQ
jgi:hypothetical protein